MFNVSLKEISDLVVGVMVYKYVQTGSLCDFLFLKRIFFCDFLSVCVVKDQQRI